MKYEIRCDDCKKVRGFTSSVGISAMGGLCDSCKKKTFGFMGGL